MIRLKILAEGQTEETFVKDVLAPHLENFGIYTTVFCATTSRRRRRPDVKFKGGISSYEQIHREVRILLAEDQRPEARLSTMFDLYALPSNFPGFDDAQKKNDPYERVQLIEAKFGDDFKNHRLIPYIQLHEFETLVLVDPTQLLRDFPAHRRPIEKLAGSIEGQQPEFINDGVDTAPSKRIIQAIPEYRSRKRQVGPRAVERIGIEKIRSVCPHFRQWLERLEALGDS